MSKNLTRKSLAFGALVALGSSVIAGAPAFAADTTLVPSLGTSTKMIAGEAFELTASLASNIPTSNISQLRFKVESASGVALSAISIAGTALTSSNDIDYATTGSTAEAFGASDTSAVFGLSSLSNVSYAKLSIATAAGSSSSWTVSSWLDSNNDGLVNGSETASSSPVSFVKQADVTSAITITAPVEGDTIVTAGVRFNDINNEQLTNTKVGLKFTKGDDTALSSNNANVRKTVAAWDATNGFVAAATADAALAKDTAVKVQAFYEDSALTYADAEKIGAAQTASVTARKLATFTAAVVRSATAKDSGTGTAASLLNKAFEAKVTAKDGSTTPVAVANVPVTVKVATTASLSGTAGSVVSLTVNGKVYTDSTKLPGTATTGDAKVATTTDASGVAKVAISTEGFTNQTITVTFYAENFSSQVVVTPEAATYSAYALASNGNVATTVDGTAVSIPVAVYDQFGGVPADEYDVRAVFDSAATTAQATTAATTATSTNVALVGGKATLSILDNGTGEGVNVYDITVEKRQAGGGYSGQITQASSAATISNFAVQIQSAASLVPGLVTITGSGTLNSTSKVHEITGASLELADFGSYDERAVLGTEPDLNATVNIAGNVKTLATATSAAALIDGTKVVLSGAGLQFKATVDGKKVYATDSITVYTNGSGAFDVVVSSNKAGAQTVKVVAGAVSQDVSITFAAAAQGTGTSLVVTAPATVAPGRTLEVSALLTDKYGNPVVEARTTNVVISYEGPGLVVGTLPTTFGTDGVAKFRVLLGAGDSGSAVATFKYSDADSDFTDTTDIVKTATVSIAAAAVVEPTSKIGTANSRVYVNVKDGKGSVVSVKIGAKWFTRSALNNDYTLSFKAKKKSKVSVKVYVDGDLSSSKTITVK